MNMPARSDARLGAPVATGEPLDHVCPCCNGAGDTSSVECVCNGRGVITAELAREFAAIEPTDPAWAPRALGPVPVFDGQRCHDCAFRPDSLERDGRTAAQLYDQLARGNADRPFFCHQGMHEGAQGYVPRQRDADGAPIGHPVCAGWLQLYQARTTRSA